uniref:Uncharacterized protein n=1 Tax=Salix viminalis TaxID=40686 RepID=A0A6N2N863_SALVM
MADLTGNAAQMKEWRELEGKLKTSDDDFCKADSLLSQALLNISELEQKLKSLEDLHNESGAAAATASQKNLELEDLIKASNEAAEEAKSQLRELETRFTASEQKNVELEKQLNLVELKSSDAEREVREFSEKISELSIALKEAEEEKKLLKLEEELKIAREKCSEHEDRANMHHQRGLELEDSFQTSHSRAEDAVKRQMTERCTIKELEEQNSALEKKRKDAEADSNKYSDRISELASEIEAYQARLLGRKKELTELLNLVTNEKKTLEEASSSSNERLTEAENLVGVLRNELVVMQGRLESIENDLKAAGLKESDIMVKLKSAEEQLEQQEKLLEEATTRRSELESLNETLTRDTEIKLQEALANFTNKDSEAKTLFEKLNALEDQVKTYKELITETTGRSALLKEELDLCVLKMATLETSNEELKSQIVEAETKVSNSFSENELLVETNNQLKSKIDELQELLASAISEKEATSQQLVSHVSTITEITDKHSRAIELHSATESRMVQAEAREAGAIAESRKVELEETLLKVKHLENIVEELKTKSGHYEKESGGLAEANFKLTQELASYESKLGDLEAKLSAILSEKDETVEQLHISKKAVEDLRQQLSDEGQKLQSQLEEELNGQKANGDALKSEIESLKAEVAEKLALQTSIEELKKQLTAAESQLKEQVPIDLLLFSYSGNYFKELVKYFTDNFLQCLTKQKEVDSHNQLEKDEALKKSLEDLEAKNKEVSHLENQVKELELKLQVAGAKLLEKGDGSNPAEQKDGVEIKSRDIGAAISTPTKRKSKKKLEAAAAQAPSTSQTHTKTADVSPAMTFKIILGVALVSIIIGVYLGKRY